MIEGPCSGAISEADNASAADVAALTGVVATNTTAIATKAAAADLTTAEGTLTTHTGQIASLNNSYNNLGNSFYTKVFTDALLYGKQAVVGDGVLTIARTSGLQTVLDGKHGTIQCLATNALTTFTIPAVCNFDLQCADLTANSLYGGAIVQINSAIASATAGKQDNYYGAVPNAASFTSKTGTWTINPTSADWSTDLQRVDRRI